MTTNNKRVLIVEDDRALRDAFSTVLSMRYTVDTAENGKQALDLCQDNTYDIIVLDLMMPVMDGKAFLKAWDNTAQVPVIVFSNMDAKQDVEEALALGATRYLLKSWASPKELIRIVDETIAS